ncbi:helix-turn-helix transcriptional regulator [uncultured Eubacterium sp.]|uniref:helix-turn-helix transcriptional regulator n=1 Tax=Eubacterium sp. TaxID=142586 RepID=UPI003267FBA9
MNIKDARNIRGLTQNDVSEIFDIPRRTIVSWELNERKAPEYLKNFICEKILNMTNEEFDYERQYVAVDSIKTKDEIVAYKGSKTECIEFIKSEENAGDDRDYFNLTLKKYSIYDKNKKKLDMFNLYYRELCKKTIYSLELDNVDDSELKNCIIEFEKTEYNKKGTLKRMKTVYHMIDKREKGSSFENENLSFESLKFYFKPDKEEFPEEYEEWRKIEDLQDLEEFIENENPGMETPYEFLTEKIEERKSRN